ncbi:MAG TPA: hypothetical protein VIM84_15095 [Gemmatimonadales bacterium]
MAWHTLGQVTVPTPGTRVRLTSQLTDPTARYGCQSILIQAISTGSHTNTGRVYLFEGPVSTVPLVTLAVPASGSIPSASATIPTAPSGLNAADYYVDADVATDGVNVSALR